jgi:RNA polymerase sigma factor (sigma-70 family)
VLEPNVIPNAPSASQADAAPGVVATRVFSPRTTSADDVETLYVQHRTLLLSVACRKFRVPESDAESLLQEVFLSFLQTGTKIDNVRAWLVAAICNASRHYWRTQGRTEALPEDYMEHSDPVSHALPEKRAMQITVQQALAYLQPRCRETLRLHYFDGRSAAEVARELETTTRYAEKLIHNCLKRVREIYLNITAVSR